MKLLEKLQARKELNRIENRYVKRNNRNAWKSDSEYVNGEYVYKCRQQVEPPPPRVPQKRTASVPRSSNTRPSTHSSVTSDASKRSSTMSPSKLSKRFSTSFGWR